MPDKASKGKRQPVPKPRPKHPKSQHFRSRIEGSDLVPSPDSRYAVSFKIMVSMFHTNHDKAWLIYLEHTLLPELLQILDPDAATASPPRKFVRRNHPLLSTNIFDLVKRLRHPVAPAALEDAAILLSESGLKRVKPGWPSRINPMKRVRERAKFVPMHRYTHPPMPPKELKGVSECYGAASEWEDWPEAYENEETVQPNAVHGNGGWEEATSSGINGHEHIHEYETKWAGVNGRWGFGVNGAGLGQLSNIGKTEGVVDDAKDEIQEVR